MTYTQRSEGGSEKIRTSIIQKVGGRFRVCWLGDGRGPDAAATSETRSRLVLVLSEPVGRLGLSVQDTEMRERGMRDEQNQFEETRSYGHDLGCAGLERPGTGCRCGERRRWLGAVGAVGTVASRGDR